MIYLTNSTDRIQVVLANIVTSFELDWVATFHRMVPGPDKVKDDFTHMGRSDGTTPVIMVPGPDEQVHVRVEVSELNVYNFDTAAVTVIVQIDRNGTKYLLYKQELQAGEHLQYTDGGGFAHAT